MTASNPFARLASRLRRWSSSQRLAVILMAVMVAVAGMLVGSTLYSARVMDRLAIENQRDLIDNSITRRLAQAIYELRSVACWDELIRRTDPGNFDRHWLDVEVGAYLTESSTHDRVIILDERNHPVYSYAEGRVVAEAQLRADLATALPLIQQARGGPDVSKRVEKAPGPDTLYEYATGSTRKIPRGFGGVMQLNGKPVMAMAMLINPSSDYAVNSPLRRIILSIKKIDAKLLSQVGRDTLMNDLTVGSPVNDRSAAFLLRTDAGEPIATLSWTPRQPGTKMSQRILPGMFAGFLLAALMVVALAGRLIRSTGALARREEEAQSLANHDALTGLPNRRKLESELLRHAVEAGRSDLRLAVACLDLDRFKDINDTLGHHAGDQLIRCVSERLRAALDEADFVARLGGDEFAILRQCDGVADADQLLSKIRSCFDEPFAINGHLVETSASVGLAFASPDRSFDQMMREADIALYEAKARGRGGSVRFEAAMGRKIERRRALEVDLRKAIANRELSVLYQPIVEAASGHITSVEALVRWTSARHGEVPPDVFVPIAEEAGLMGELGRFVIDRAVSDSRKWPRLETAINISPAQLRSVSVLNDLIEPTERHGVSPTMITIEITETVLMANDDRTLRTLNVLKERGFSLALDDFGTGYSSLAYIRDFPFDKLKIDRSFLKNLDTSDRAIAIIEAIANFGKILGRDIVAEGVETEQEMQAMQRAGCTHLQGFLFARPLPAAHVELLAGTFGRLSSGGIVDKAGDNIAMRSISRRV